MSKTKEKQAQEFLQKHYNLPIMRKRVGVCDKYNKGMVIDMIFAGVLVEVNVKYKNKSILYRWEE